MLLECDENAHGHYNLDCELKRQMVVALGFGGRPVYLIRYNPDTLPGMKLPAKKEREALLLSRLQAAVADAPVDDPRFNHILTVEYLFYFAIPGSTATAAHIQTLYFNCVVEYEAWVNETTRVLKAAAVVATAPAAAGALAAAGSSSV